MRITSDCIENRVIDSLARRIRSQYAKTRDFSSAPVAADYQDPSLFSADLLLHSYLKKWKGKPVEDIESITVESWRTAEKQCFRTNQRLNAVVDNDFFRACREKIASVIGNGPPRKLVNMGRWSNGATAQTRRGVHFSKKLEGPVACTPAALNLVPLYFQGMSSYGIGEIMPCRANRCIQVPKTFKINRMIAAEPAANAFMQQSVGAFLKEKLLTVGINLLDQTPNQRAAFHARVDDLSTIDLEMASDTLSSSLVRLIVPEDWFSFLNQLRCQFSEIGGKTVFLDKFTSMGNAFTFELETLIFWAICSCVSNDSPVLVYGDDIICPRNYYDDICLALRYCGFIVNQSKSFKEGAYFESCGKHFFDLEDVTPVYQKERIQCVPSLFRAYNRLYRWGLRNNLALVKDALLLILGEIPEKFHLWIPVCERDDGLISATHAHRVDRNGDFRCSVLRSCPRFEYAVNDGLALACKLKSPSISAEDPRGYFAVVRESSAFRKRKVVIWRASVGDKPTISWSGETN